MNKEKSIEVIWIELNKNKQCIIFNHPNRSLRRYQLLKKIKDINVNRFNIFRLNDNLNALTFPVFLRRENDHHGSLSDLIHNTEDLNQGNSNNKSTQKCSTRHSNYRVRGSSG